MTGQIFLLMNQYEIFAALHQAENPVIIGNIWDVESARLLAESGFKAIATSSAAVANALGYGDGEQLPVDLLLDAVNLLPFLAELLRVLFAIKRFE